MNFRRVGKRVDETMESSWWEASPKVSRVLGAIVMAAGLVVSPVVVVTGVDAIRRFGDGEERIDALDLTFQLFCARVIVQGAVALGLVVFGGLLLAVRRRHAALWAYVLIVPTVAEGMLTLALEGVVPDLLGPISRLVVLIGASIALDPGLIAERRLQHTLRRMDEFEDYEKDAARGMVGRDETGRGYIALDFFNIFWLFVIASVFGLALETVYRFVTSGAFEDRAGLLWGPFSPIYGCGAVLLTVILNRLWRSNPWLIFAVGAVVGGAFEYLVSWFMEVAFGITAWDYTGQWLSVGGRTSGKYMIFWGLLSVLWVKLLLPRTLALINLIPWRVRYSLTTVCAVLMVIDIAMTLMAFDCWYGRMAGRASSAPITDFFATHFGNDVMAHRFQTMHIDPSRSGRL
ncbi:hypothetical protein [uncultured Bifidobacterium sp.]|uniref:putative ABC transporter permease n=1 Tax=uncultured Bifidobacterium sp. TaxID=165187 RepID=UPI00261418CB|nr:hypothetical protein [uncultured Bifidobacterium sp.]